MLRKVRVVAIHRGPRWLIWIKRKLRPYEYVTLLEATIRRPVFESEGYVGAIKLLWGFDTPRGWPDA